MVALRKESVDRNYHYIIRRCSIWVSLSARRAWIEILLSPSFMASQKVALRKESVDRNVLKKYPVILGNVVALRKESVDRNICIIEKTIAFYVALRKESVDRNSTYVTRLPRCQVSLSARRAWIEIFWAGGRETLSWSLSARRAWIEMMFWLFLPSWSLVALRKESVDRNSTGSASFRACICRSPQGERG